MNNVHTCYIHGICYVCGNSVHTCCLVLPRWTQEELKKVIAMLQDPEFDSKDIDPDLHKRMDKAVQDGRIKCFNMRESAADGDQDLISTCGLVRWKMLCGK